MMTVLQAVPVQADAAATMTAGAAAAVAMTMAQAAAAPAGAVTAMQAGVVAAPAECPEAEDSANHPVVAVRRSYLHPRLLHPLRRAKHAAIRRAAISAEVAVATATATPVAADAAAVSKLRATKIRVKVQPIRGSSHSAAIP